MSSCALCGAPSQLGRGTACVDLCVVSADSAKILDGVTLSFAAGSSTCILAESGAGGTTLLRALANRLDSRGAPRCDSGVCAVAGPAVFVAEHDEHEPFLTVREALDLAYACSYGFAPILASVDCAGCCRLTPARVVDALNLGAALDCQAGLLSGGQKRRLTLAEALVCGAGGAECRPPVFALDCAASGLDSVNSEVLFKIVVTRTRALHGVLVATLKAPEPELFELFDSVILLSRGRVVYHGPPSEVSVRESIGLVVPPRVMLSDFLCSIVAGAGAVGLADVFRESDIAAADRAASLSRCMIAAPLAPLPAPRTTLGQMRVLIPSLARRTARNSAVIKARITSTIIVGSILGWLSSSAADTPTPDWRLGMFLYAPVFLAFADSSELPRFYVSRAVVYRQTRASQLSTLAWTVSSVAASVPLVFIVVFLFSTLVYWPGGFTGGVERYLVFFLTLFLFDRAIAELLMVIASLFSTPAQAQPVVVMIIDSFMLFSGYYIGRSSMPDYIAWLCFLSPVYWVIETLGTNEFRADKYAVTGVDTQVLNVHGYINSDFVKWGGVLFLAVTFSVALLCLAQILQFCQLSDIVAHRGAARRPHLALATNAVPVYAPCHCAPLTVKFNIETYTTTDGKILLRDVHGSVLPNTVTALMGLSGSGKTTLLDLLAHRKPSAGVVGRFSINDAAVPYSSLGAVARFAQQVDLHFPFATVCEAFTFSMKLRHTVDFLGSVELRARAIASTLDLDPDRVVETLSDGELKRLTIGVEIAAEGSLLFADEPTTHLQSSEANDVMAAIVRLAISGHSVIVTLHQPSRDIFAHVTHAIVLGPRGSLAYEGDVGENGSTVVNALIARGASPPTATANIARWVTNASAVVTAQQEDRDDSDVVVERPFDGVAGSTVLREVSRRETRPLQGICQQTFVLLTRAARERWRNRRSLAARAATTVFLAVFLGLVFSTRTIEPTVSSTRSTVGFFLSAAALLAVISMQMAVTTHAERALPRDRELASAMYSPTAFIITSFSLELPEILMSSLVFSAIAYSISSLQKEASVFFFFFLCVSTLSTALVSLAIAFVVMTPTAAVAQIMSGLTIAVIFLFSGLLLPPDSMPDIWVGLFYAVPSSHVLRAMSVAQLFCVPATSPACPVITVGNPPVSASQFEYVQQLLGLPLSGDPDRFRWSDVGYASLTIVVGLFVACVALEIKTRRKRS